MALRYREPLPVAAEELARIRAEITFDHGSRLHEAEGVSILIARSPHVEPDMVNDIEEIVERVSPADVARADKLLLVGQQKVHQVPLAPLKDLLATRTAEDRQSASDLRATLPKDLGHQFFRSPSDPKRRLRLAIRLPCQQVDEVTDATLERLVDRLGPRLENGGFADVHCVYLIADRDDVRIDPEAFVADLVSRWQDEDRRRRIEQERAAKLQALERQRRDERQRLIAELEGIYDKRVAYAPVKSVGERPPGVHRDGPVTPGSLSQPSAAQEPTRPLAGALSTDPLDPVRARVDALPMPKSQAMTTREVVGSTSAPAGIQSHEEAGAPTAVRSVPVGLQPLADRLAKAGFDVLPEPDVPGYQIGLAAERDGAYPQRIIAIHAERLTRIAADDLLDAARALDVDIAVAVAQVVEPQAQRRIIATKVRHIKPEAVGRLDL